jgi:hypothetical protein
MDDRQQRGCSTGLSTLAAPVTDPAAPSSWTEPRGSVETLSKGLGITA